MAIKQQGVPTVRVKSAGRVNARLDTLARAYKQQNPTMDVRWVWSPQNKPDLSNVLDRQIDGYRLVTVEELGSDIAEFMPGMQPDEVVRVGDVVLMSIDADKRAGFKAEKLQLAQDELKRVDRQFHDELEKLNQDLNPEHKIKVRGEAHMEEVEREITVDPSLRES